MIPVSVPFPYHADRVEARLAVYAGRMHRLHDKREVIIEDSRHERAGPGPNGRKTTRRISSNRL